MKGTKLSSLDFTDHLSRTLPLLIPSICPLFPFLDDLIDVAFLHPL